jgi:hypothetical protein
MRHGLSFGVPYDEGVNARGAGLNDFRSRTRHRLPTGLPHF